MKTLNNEKGDLSSGISWIILLTIAGLTFSLAAIKFSNYQLSDLSWMQGLSLALNSFSKTVLFMFSAIFIPLLGYHFYLTHRYFNCHPLKEEDRGIFLPIGKKLKKILGYKLSALPGQLPGQVHS